MSHVSADIERPRPRRRWLRRMALAVLALGLALAALYALRWRLLSGTVTRMAEEKLGGLLSARVRVEGVSGSLLTSLELHGVDIQPDPGSPLADAGRAGRLRLEYSPWLLLGDAGAVSRISVEDAELVLGPQGEAGAGRSSGLDLRGLLGAARSFAGRPEVSVARLDLDWEAARVRGLTGRLTPRGSAGRGRLEAEFDARSLAAAGRDFGAVSGRAALSWPGRDSDAVLEGDAELRDGAVSGSARFLLPLGDPGPHSGCGIELDVRTSDLPGLLALPAGWDRLAGGVCRSAALHFSADGALGTLFGSGWLELRPDGGDGADGARGGRVPFSLADGTLTLAETELDLPVGRLSFGGALPLEALVRAAGGEAPAGEVSGLHAELWARDVAALAEFLPGRLRDELLARMPQATLRFSVLLRRGPKGFEPEVGVSVRDGELRPPAPLTALTDVNLDLRLAAGELTLERAAARMELGELEANGRLRLADGRLGARISGRDLLVADGADGLRLRADIDLALEGDLSSATLSGRASLPLVRYRREFAGASTAGGGAGLLDRNSVLLPLAMELPVARTGGVELPGLPGFAWLGLDVALDADGDVSVENSTVGALLAGRLRVRGTAAAPVLSGELRTLSGEVRLFPGIFLEITRCRLLLSDKPGAAPQMDFASEMAAQRIRVFANVTGPLSAPVLRLTSSPPCSQDELLALLLYGRMPGTLTAGQAGSAVLGQAGRVLGGMVVDRPPRARPERGLLARLSLGYGSESGARPGGVLRRQTASGNVFFAEYAISKLLSIVTSRDGLGGVNVDLQARLCWPRPPGGGPAGGSDRSGEAASAGGARRAATFFVGNRAIRTSRLMKAIAPDLARLGPDGWTAVAASDAADRLRQHCLDAGHFMARVSASVDGGAAEFAIEEGPRVRLGRVQFSGSSSLSDERLRAALFRDGPGLRSAPFTARLLDAQVRSLLAFCREEGFLLASADEPVTDYDPDRLRMNVTHRIHEGTRFTLREVSVAGVEGEEAAAVSSLARPFLGGPLRQSVPGRLAAAVRNRYRETGKLRVEVEVERVLDAAAGVGRLTVTVRPGPTLRLAAVNVSGARNSTPEFVRRLSGLRPGQELTQVSLRRAERRLAESGAFRSLFYEIDETGAADPVTGGQLVDLDLSVTEVEPYEAAVRLGYGSFDGVRAGGEVGTRNIFGRAERLAVGGGVSQRGYRLYADSSLPPWPGLPLTVAARAFFEERDDVSFSERNYGISPSLAFRLTPRDTLSTGLLFEWIETDGIPSGVPEGDLQNFRLAEAFVGLTCDRRDAPVLARSGYLASVRAALTDESVYGDISCTQLSGTLAGYLPLTDWLTLAASVQGRMIRPYDGTAEIPIALRLFGGGPDTVRGFRDRMLGPTAGDDPIGGELLTAAQTELRVRLWRELYGAAFLDAGNVYSRVDGADLGELRWGLGPGLRYHTPAGAIGLDVGFNPDRRRDEPSPVLHLTLGLSF